MSLFKIANDLRWMGSGPRTGLAEIRLPDLQPGSSIMPGKVNPVIAEVVTQVGVQVMGNDAAVAFAGSQGNFELNVFVPLIARNLLESIRLLTAACRVFADKCVAGIEANVERMKEYAESSPSIGTALNPYLGYEVAAEIVKEVDASPARSVREIVKRRKLMTDEELDRALDVLAMTRGGIVVAFDRGMSSHEGSRQAIIAAFLANLGIALSKFVVFLITGAASMLAEAIHSFADTGNQGLLLLDGSRVANKPADDEHPFGYGNRRYFWAFIVALVLFSVGGLFAIFEGIEKLRHPHELENIGLAIGILLFAVVLESWSFRTALVETNREREAGTSLWRHIRRRRSPELPVVLLEDTGALIGLTFALFGVTLAHFTDEPRWDAAGSLAIGILLVVIALFLAIEMASLLLGEAASPQNIAKIRTAIESHDCVMRIIHLRTEHIGPDEIVLATKLEFDHGMTIEALADEIDRVEVSIRAAVPATRLIFIEPDVYREEAVS